MLVFVRLRFNPDFSLRYLGFGIDACSILKQEVDHLGVTIVTSYN